MSLLKYNAFVLLSVALISESFAQAPAQQYVFAEGANGRAGLSIVNAGTGVAATILPFPSYSADYAAHHFAVSPDYSYVYVVGDADGSDTQRSVWILNYAGGGNQRSYYFTCLFR